MSGKYLSQPRLTNISKLVEEKDSIFTEAYKALRKQADSALDSPLLSVRDNGGSPYFRQDAAYIPGKDGIMNLEANHESGNLAGRFSSLSFDLALAYRLTGDEQYADKALELIHCWCINQNTRMFATGYVEDAATPGAQYGGDIIIFARFYRAFLAMYLLDDCPQWDLACQAATRRWVRDMVEPQRQLMFFNGYDMYNNWEDARLLYLASGALFLNDLDLLLYVFERWRTIIPMKMTDEGELPRETGRTRSMHYTLFALHSSMLVAEFGSAYGYELYDYSINGRCLKKAVDYAARYLLDMDNWPFQMVKPIEDEIEDMPLDVFEFAYARWGDGRYLEVLDRYKCRPVTDGHATLLSRGRRE